MNINYKILVLILIMSFMETTLLADENDLKLQHDFPATNWEADCFPIGNGRMGAMIFGGMGKEEIQFNEDSLWTGGENISGKYESLGAYQNFGSVIVDFRGEERSQLDEIKLNGINTEPEKGNNNYLRELDLANAIHSVSFESNGVKYLRETFASHPRQMIVSRLTASKKGKYSGSIRLQDAHEAKTAAEKNQLSIKGKLSNGLQYESILHVINVGGTLKADKNSLTFDNCDSLVLLLTAGTDYIMDYSRKWKGEHPHEHLAKNIASTTAMDYDKLKKEHITDFQSLFNRVTLDLGKSDKDQKALPLHKRIETYKKTPNPKGFQGDPELEAMLFQYGRYLLISCSRPGSLPANLQGVWNNINNPEWNSDYHTNINVQMNYWLSGPANLAECNLPFIDLAKAITEPSRKATQKAFGKVRGFTYRTSHNIFGGQGWQWNIPASAWYAQHLWEHYAFTQDKKYLKDTAYPYLKEVCEYWEDHLKELPDGTLVVPDGWSPEHGPREDGVAHDQQIVWDLFTNYIEASDALKIDKEYKKKVSDMRDKLLGPKIGKWGQLQEWVEDRDDPETGHRHTSHLFAVYPGRQISVSETPEFAKAAMISLKARGDTGDSQRSWTWPWRCAMWARFHKGEDCHRMIKGLLRYNTLPNLITTHPPLQLDGSFGITAGMCEIFIQSHASSIELLPALPSEWPDGSIKGLCARGDFLVDISWLDGKLSKVRVHSKSGKEFTLKYGETSRKLKLKAGKSIVLNGGLKD